jgi:hypothetical protein
VSLLIAFKQEEAIAEQAENRMAGQFTKCNLRKQLKKLVPTDLSAFFQSTDHLNNVTRPTG